MVAIVIVVGMRGRSMYMYMSMMPMLCVSVSRVWITTIMMLLMRLMLMMVFCNHLNFPIRVVYIVLTVPGSVVIVVVIAGRRIWISIGVMCMRVRV